MNEKWSLDSIYKGYDDEKYIADMNALESEIAKFASLVENPPKDAKEALVKMLTCDANISNLAETLYPYSALRQRADTSDSDAVAQSGKVMEKLSKLSLPNAKFVAYVSSIKNLDEVIKQDAFLQEHSYMLHNIEAKKQYTLSPDTENALSLYEMSGSSAWGQLQSYLTSTLEVEYDGGITTLPSIRNKAYDKDAKVRRTAYEAELKSYEKIKGGVAFALNSIKKEVLSRCALRGYPSPLDESLINAHMKRETLEALLGAMKEYMPKFREYLKAKAKLLGYKNGLPWFEIFAPLEGNEREFTTEEARDYLVKLFSGFDKEEADLIKKAFDEAWIDFYPRKGKVGGAFCWGMHPAKESRVLTNFDGAIGDVVTLAHELGHAFHNHCLENNSVLNTDVSMPVAETASTFNEVVAMNAAIAEEKDPKAKRALIENQLQDATQIIVDIYSRFLFESAVFENRKDAFLFPDKLCELMTNAQKEAFGDGLDPNYLHPYAWVNKSHYYRGGLSFYNYPYAFGGLFARGLYAKYLKEGPSFVPLYKKMLAATGYSTVEDAAKVANIDLTDINFWRSSLQILADEIDEFISLC